MLARGEAEVAEAFYFQWTDAVGGGVDFKHWLVPQLLSVDPLHRK